MNEKSTMFIIVGRDDIPIYQIEFGRKVREIVSFNLNTNIYDRLKNFFFFFFVFAISLER